MATVAHDLERERAALRQTLLDVGPDAPTACGDWTTTDLAVHLAIGEMFGGVPPSPARILVNRGIRIDRLSRFNTRALMVARRRRGFDWAMARLARRPPRAHQFRAVVAVSLTEVWAHHEDVLLGNDLSPCTSGVDLQPVVSMLARYQRKVLARAGVHIGENVSGAPSDLARWLAGRAGAEALTLSGDADPEAVSALRLGV